LDLISRLLPALPMLAGYFGYFPVFVLLGMLLWNRINHEIELKKIVATIDTGKGLYTVKDTICLPVTISIDVPQTMRLKGVTSMKLKCKRKGRTISDEFLENITIIDSANNKICTIHASKRMEIPKPIEYRELYKLYLYIGRDLIKEIEFEP